MSFLAALAALGLPWSSLTDCFVIVLDSIQSLPAFQKKTWPDQQKDNDEDKYKDNNDNDEYI